MFIHSLNWVLTKYLPQLKLTFIEEILGGENTWWNLLSNLYSFMRTKNCGSRWEKNICGNREEIICLITIIILSWLDLLIFVANLWIWIKVVIKCGSFETSRCYSFRVTFRYDATQFKGRIFCVAQTCPCLDFYGGSPLCIFPKTVKVSRLYLL